MSRFQFRLAGLLHYRESLRDQCRQALAQWLARDAALAEKQIAIEQERRLQHDEMRLALQAGGERLIDRVAGRRYHLSQLAVLEETLEKQRREVARRVDACRQALVHADQGVKALERLSDKQRAEFLVRAERLESRALEEIWQAGRGKDV